MEIRMFSRHISYSEYGTTLPGGIFDDHEIKQGQCNEYYLPALNSSEAWIIITDNDGRETKIHLKR